MFCFVVSPLTAANIIPVPKLNYTYNALRQVNMQEYESRRHTMPLIKIETTTNITAVNITNINISIEKNGYNKIDATAQGMRTDWISQYKYPTSNNRAIVADFEKLREAIIDSKFEIIPNTTHDICTTPTHLHPGDIINVQISYTVTEQTNPLWPSTRTDSYSTPPIPIYITDKYYIAYVVRGPVRGYFYTVDNTLPDLQDNYFDRLKQDFEVTAVNAWAEFDELNYRPFDLIVLTDYPGVGSKAENEGLNKPDPNKPEQTDINIEHPYLLDQLVALVGMRPIFSWKSFFGKLVSQDANGTSITSTDFLLPKWTGTDRNYTHPYNFKIDKLPLQPNWNNYWDNYGTAEQVDNYYNTNNRTQQNAINAYEQLLTMQVVCDHSIFRRASGIKKDDSDSYDLKMLNHLNVDGNAPSQNSKARVGLQGFTRGDLGNDFVPIAEITLPEKNTKGVTTAWTDDEKTLYTCIEWQGVANARFMIFAIYKDALLNLTNNGYEVTKAAIEYLLDANPGHIEDCAYTFDNGYDYYYVKVDEEITDENKTSIEQSIINDFLFIYSDLDPTAETTTSDMIHAEMDKLGAELLPISYYQTNDATGEVEEVYGYRVRFNRDKDGYEKKFKANKEAFENDNKGEKYPFALHDNKWRNPANWIQNNLPSQANDVRLRAMAVLDSATYEVNEVRINNMVGSLHINPTGGLKANGAFQQYDGARSYKDRSPIDAKYNTLVQVLADKDHNGMLVHQHPNNNFGELYATVSLYSPAKWELDDKAEHYPNTPISAYKYWTYFGLPIKQAPIPDYFFGAYTFQWHEKDNEWDRMGDYTTLYSMTTENGSTKLNGFALSQESEITWTLPGELNDAKNITVALSYNKEHTVPSDITDGANILGNPWTAPIHIDKMDKETDFINADPTIYIYRSGRDPGWDKPQLSHNRPSHGATTNTGAEDEGYWFGIPVETCQQLGWAGLTVIPAMQAFLVWAMDKNATIKLDYTKLVSAPIGVNQIEDHAYMRTKYDADDPDNAAVRVNNTARRIARQQDDDQQLLRIIVADTASFRDIYLVEGTEFTYDYDLGWEAYYMSSPNFGLWVDTKAGLMSVAALPNLNGTMLNFSSNQRQEYTFSFNDWEGEELYFNDLLLKQSTPISASAEYTFTAEEGLTTNRFYLSRIPIESSQPDIDIVDIKSQILVSNPTQEQLYISLYDSAGRLLAGYISTSPQINIDMPDQQGVYLVSVQSESTSISKKVIR